MGLFAFFYGTLHFMIYFVLDRSLMLDGLWEDIVKRPYITMGFTAFVLMIPLALTSTKGWIRRLGGQRWNLLHKLVYMTAILGVIHYWWKVKLDVTDPMFYAAIVAILLGARIIRSLTKRQATAAGRARRQRARDPPSPPKSPERLRRGKPARSFCLRARHQLPGKTRLTANLSDDDARTLREALLLDTLEVVRSVNVPVTLAYTPDNARAEMEAYVDRGPWTVGRGPWASLRPQRGDDLGARMHCALTDAFAAGATQVLLIGSDLPTLPPTHLGDAFGVLESIDCVFGPADDGGYYLIGVRRGVDLSRIVTGVRWGTARCSRGNTLGRPRGGCHNKARQWVV